MSAKPRLLIEFSVGLLLVGLFLTAFSGCESEPPVHKMSPDEFRSSCNPEGICDGSPGASMIADGYDVCLCVETGKVYRKLRLSDQSYFETRIVNQEWTGLRAGTQVSYGNGKKGTVASDVIGCQVHLKIKNISPMTRHIHPPVYLIGEDELPIQEFHIKEDKSLADFPKEGIPLKPNEVMEITFDSAMGSMDEYKHSNAFYIAGRCWKLPLEPLRVKDVKFK
jgi:hypothetical protein